MVVTTVEQISQGVYRDGYFDKLLSLKLYGIKMGGLESTLKVHSAGQYWVGGYNGWLARLVAFELQIHRYPVSTFKLFQTVVAHALIPAILRKKQGNFWVCGHPGIKGEFQDKQIYTEKPCLVKKKIVGI